MFLEICMQVYSIVFVLSRQINKQKVCEDLLCAGNKVFVKYQAQGGVLTPTPPCVRPWTSLVQKNKTCQLTCGKMF